jgi:uncharacterized protein YpmB
MTKKKIIIIGIIFLIVVAGIFWFWTTIKKKKSLQEENLQNATLAMQEFIGENLLEPNQPSFRYSGARMTW